MSEYVAETYENEKFRVKIIADFDPQNPRTEWDNLGTMVCWHSRYNLGDKHDFIDPDDFYEWLKTDGKGAIVLPLYLLDHSGITMSTRSCNDPWDSGQVGYIYCEREKILKEFQCKRISKRVRNLVIKNLEAEVKTYDQFLGGDVWGFVIERVEDDEHLDSCWGFYGYADEPRENGMWEHWSEDIRKLVDPRYEINPDGYFMDKQLDLALTA